MGANNNNLWTHQSIESGLLPSATKPFRNCMSPSSSLLEKLNLGDLNDQSSQSTKGMENVNRFLMSLEKIGLESVSADSGGSKNKNYNSLRAKSCRTFDNIEQQRIADSLKNTTVKTGDDLGKVSTVKAFGVRKNDTFSFSCTLKIDLHCLEVRRV